jgi:hypothetical protein
VSSVAIVALICLLTLPALSVALSVLLHRFPKLNLFSPLPAVIAAGLAWLAAWVLRGQDFEGVIGGWTPVSLTASPIILASFTPGAALIIAWAGLFALRLLRQQDEAVQGFGYGGHDERLLDALMLAGLVFAAFANSATALLLGLGLVDGVSFVAALLSPARSRTVALRLLLNGASLVLLTAMFALHLSQGNLAPSGSAYFPLMHIGSYLQPFADTSLFLRCAVAPLTTPSHESSPHWQASSCATLLLMAHLPGLGLGAPAAWLIALIVFSGALAAGLACLADSPSRALPMLNLAAFYGAAASIATGQSSAIAAAGMAWLLGHPLLQTSLNQPAPFHRMAQAARLAGAAAWAGLPLVVGFVGQAGIVATLAQQGVLGWLGLVGWVIGLALLAATALRIALAPMPTQLAFGLEMNPSGWNWRTALAFAPLLVLMASLLIFGLFPQLLGATGLNQPVARNGVLGWVSWLLAVVAGVAVWWYEDRWQPRLEPWRNTLENALSLKWLRDVWSGAMDRLAQPFRILFPFLESDGVLLWAIILVLLAVLVTRPGGP